MLSTLKTTALAGLIGLSTIAAVPAQADSLYLGFGDRHDDTRVGVYVGDSSDTYYPRNRWERREDRREWRRHHSCSPDRALWKAADMGIHRSRIDFVSERRIGVTGRSHGDRVYVTFARAPGCPVIG